MLHVGVHLGEDNIDHLSETCLGSVLVDGRSGDNMDRVLGFEGRKQSAVVHLAINCNHNRQKRLQHTKTMSLIVTGTRK